MIKALCLFLAALAVPSHSQQEVPVSPCPNVFEYEPPGSEPGRWYGNVNLSTDSTLHSLWLNIVLDRKADILGAVPVSPCPNVFEYEPPGSEPGRWYGNVNLSTDSTLHSLWLNIVLDRKADILGNWIGDVTTTDNTDFKIENTKMMIHPGPAVVVKFFVQYNALNPPTPRLKAIRLNGREICNADNPRPVLETQPAKAPAAPPYKPPPTQEFPVYKPPVRSPGPVDIGGGARPSNNDIQISTYPSNSQSRPQSRPQPQPSRRPDPSDPTEEEEGEGSAGVPFGGGLPTIIIPNNNNNNRPQQSPSYGNNNNNEQCGKVLRQNPNLLVVNGSPTFEGQWPWQIALYQSQTVDNKYICGGTLVSHLHVVTAAHCVTLKGSNRITNKKTLTVYLGKHNLRISVDGVQIRLVDNILKHPEYNASSYQRDLAVLRLRERVAYTEWVQPACLWPASDTSLKTIVGKRGSVVGWGFDDTGVATEELTLVEMPVVDTETCIRSYSEFFVRFTSEYTYCAGYKNGTSVCNGDSGGGMVFRINDAWYLRGIVSLSVARQHEYRCDPSHYVVFTDVAKFLPWIQQNIS